MSRVSQFLFTNTTAGSHNLTPSKLGLTTNYAVITDTANRVVLSNKTTPIDALERVTYSSEDTKGVGNGLNIQHPSPVKSGIMYQVKVEETLRTTETTDASYIVDEPVILSLSVRHPKSGNITGTLVGQAFMRLISAVTREDGTFRFDDLMRSAERPVSE